MNGVDSSKPVSLAERIARLQSNDFDGRRKPPGTSAVDMSSEDALKLHNRMRDQNGTRSDRNWECVNSPHENAYKLFPGDYEQPRVKGAAVVEGPKGDRNWSALVKSAVGTLLVYAIFAGLVTGGLFALHHFKGVPSLTVVLAVGLGAPAAIMIGLRAYDGIRDYQEKKRKPEELRIEEYGRPRFQDPELRGEKHDGHSAELAHGGDEDENTPPNTLPPLSRRGSLEIGESLSVDITHEVFPESDDDSMDFGRKGSTETAVLNGKDAEDLLYRTQENLDTQSWVSRGYRAIGREEMEKSGKPFLVEAFQTFLAYAIFAGLITGGLFALHHFKGVPSLTVVLAAGLGGPAAIMGGFRIKNAIQGCLADSRKKEELLDFEEEFQF